MMITCGTTKSFLEFSKMTVFVGFITCYEGGKYLWRSYSKITRLTRKDALDDAESMRAEALESVA